MGQHRLLLVIAVTTWLTASKKKNLSPSADVLRIERSPHTFDAVLVLTSMTTLAAITASNPVMFMTLIPFRMI